jgi:hypothetical protein
MRTSKKRSKSNSKRAETSSTDRDEVRQSMTFGELKAKLRESEKDNPERDKLLSALSKFMEVMDYSEADHVDKPFEQKFWLQTLQTYRRRVEDRNALGAQSRSSYETRLDKVWRHYFNSFDLKIRIKDLTFSEAVAYLREAHDPPLTKQELVSALRSAEIQTSLKSQDRLEDGTRNPSSVDEVKALERILGLEDGVLQRKCVKWFLKPKKKKKAPLTPDQIAFKAARNYSYSSELRKDIALEKDIRAYLHYKAAPSSSLKATTNGKKKLLRSEKGHHGSEKSGDIIGRSFRRFASFVCADLDHENIYRRGLGKSLESMRLTDLFNHDYLDAYAKYLSLRSLAENKPGQLTNTFSNLVVNLAEICNKGGFLEQHKDDFGGAVLSDDEWKQKVADDFDWLTDLRKASQASATKVRDRLNTLEVLRERRPLAATIKVIDGLEADIELLKDSKDASMAELRNTLIATQLFYAIEAILFRFFVNRTFDANI